MGISRLNVGVYTSRSNNEYIHALLRNYSPEMKTSLREHKTDKDFGPLFSGELLRDEALEKVSEHNESWMRKCVVEAELFAAYRGDKGFTGEDLRFHVTSMVGHPNHPNAYGALINTLVRRKIIKPTGEYRAMRDDSSHARKTPVYTK